MATITKNEARTTFESAEQAAEAIVVAMHGAYDPDNATCLALYLQIFYNLIDERVRHWRLHDLLAYIYLDEL